MSKSLPLPWQLDRTCDTPDSAEAAFCFARAAVAAPAAGFPALHVLEQLQYSAPPLPPSLLQLP